MHRFDMYCQVNFKDLQQKKKKNIVYLNKNIWFMEKLVCFLLKWNPNLHRGVVLLRDNSISMLNIATIWLG